MLHLHRPSRIVHGARSVDLALHTNKQSKGGDKDERNGCYSPRIPQPDMEHLPIVLSSPGFRRPRGSSGGRRGLLGLLGGLQVSQLRLHACLLLLKAHLLPPQLLQLPPLHVDHFVIDRRLLVRVQPCRLPAHILERRCRHGHRALVHEQRVLRKLSQCHLLDVSIERERPRRRGCVLLLVSPPLEGTFLRPFSPPQHASRLLLSSLGCLGHRHVLFGQGPDLLLLQEDPFRLLLPFLQLHLNRSLLSPHLERLLQVTLEAP
mmetsp:Transcript_43777/g.138339  ORF Transcript_43777/g.138339 Transcript_43777/m.138339 type:complete len:262 (-) Transcript_43777:110-895(-)